MANPNPAGAEYLRMLFKYAGEMHKMGRRTFFGNDPLWHEMSPAQERRAKKRANRFMTRVS